MSTTAQTQQTSIESRVQAVEHMASKLAARPHDADCQADSRSSKPEDAERFRWDFDQKWSNKK